MPSSPPPLPSPAEPATVPPTEPRRRSPAVVVLLVVLMLIGGILYWTVASDHHAPGSSRGIVSANVAQISPRVSGRVIAVETEDNAILEAGAVLFRIDPRPFEIAVETARASLAQAVQGVAASSAQLEAVQAQVAQARVAAEDARATATRTASLFERGITTAAARDQAQGRCQLNSLAPRKWPVLERQMLAAPFQASKASIR